MSPGVRGQVEDLNVVNGGVRLWLLNVMVVFTSSRGDLSLASAALTSGATGRSE